MIFSRGHSIGLLRSCLNPPAVNTTIGLIFLIAIIIGSASWSTAASATTSGSKIKVFVSILPQVYFVERIGGNCVDVEVMVLPGQNPATYEPSALQMTKLSRAQVYFRIGVPFENTFIPKIKNNMNYLLMVDTRKDIKPRKMATHLHPESEHHNENTADYNHHDNPDPHIWLSPKLAKKQAKTIFETMVLIDPKSKEEYAANYKLFIHDMDTLDLNIKKALAPLKGEKIFVFHPAYGYFTDAYGLRQVAVEIEGKEPKGKAFVQFIKMAKKDNIKNIFVQPQFSTKSAMAIAHAIGGTVVYLNPLAKDYIRNMEDMAMKIKNAITSQ